MTHRDRGATRLTIICQFSYPYQQSIADNFVLLIVHPTRHTFSVVFISVRAIYFANSKKKICVLLAAKMGRRPNVRGLGAAIAVLLLPTAHLFEVVVVTPSTQKSCLAAKHRFSSQVDGELYEQIITFNRMQAHKNNSVQL